MDRPSHERRVAAETPFPESVAQYDDRIALKLESLQPIRSFKLRGALNKIDQLDAAARAGAEAAIHAGSPRRVKLVPVSFGAVDPTVLLGLQAAAEDDLAARPSHHEAEGEDHNHDDFESFPLRLDPLTSPQALAEKLLRAIEQHDILRVKGFLAVAGKDMRLVVQAVGARLQHYYDRAWRADEARTGSLVVIGLKGLDRAAITRAIAG